jgi:hypothetical protein
MSLYPELAFFPTRGLPTRGSHRKGSTMKKAFLASILALLALASSARAQCSSWTNTMGIAANLGDPASLIDTDLSNDAVFIFSASSTEGVVGFLVDEVGVSELTFWYEDENGDRRARGRGGPHLHGRLQHERWHFDTTHRPRVHNDDMAGGCRRRSLHVGRYVRMFGRSERKKAERPVQHHDMRLVLELQARRHRVLPTRHDSVPRVLPC